MEKKYRLIYIMTMKEEEEKEVVEVEYGDG